MTIKQKKKLDKLNVLISSCSCENEGCSNKILLIKEDKLRRNSIGEEEVCDGRTAIADLNPQDLLDLYIFCEYHLEQDNPEDFQEIRDDQFNRELAKRLREKGIKGDNKTSFGKWLIENTQEKV